METYTLRYTKWIATEDLVCDSGNSNWGPVMTSGVGWGGRWDGGSKGRGHTCTVADPC